MCFVAPPPPIRSPTLSLSPSTSSPQVNNSVFSQLEQVWCVDQWGLGGVGDGGGGVYHVIVMETSLDAQD